MKESTIIDDDLVTDQSVMLIPKRMIFLSSVIGSVMAGAILMAVNYYRKGYRREIIGLIILAMIYCFRTFNYLISLDFGWYIFVVLQALGGVLLIGPIWNIKIGKKYKFRADNRIVLPFIINAGMLLYIYVYTPRMYFKTFNPLLELFYWITRFTN